MLEEQEEGVTMKGIIENPVADYVVFSAWGMTEPFVQDTAWLGDDGSFTARIDLDRCRPVTFAGGNEISSMYLCPGDSIFMTLNTEAFDETISYKGTGAERNNFMAEFYLKFEDTDNESIIRFYDIRDTSESIYMSLMDQQYRDMNSLLDEAVAEYGLEAEFVNFMKTRIYFEKVSNMYALSMRSNRDTTEASLELDRKIGDYIIAAAGFSDPDYLSPEYGSWLTYYLRRQIYNEIRDAVPEYDQQVYDSLFYLRMEELLEPFALQMYVIKNATSLAASYNVERFEMLFPRIEQYVTDPAWKDALQAKYDDVMEKMSQPLPEDIEIYNLDDEELLSLKFDDILDRYKGDVLYVDFWASWCGPCKAEMPNSAALAEKLEGEDVTFLYISVDRDAKAWEDMIRIMQIHGIHYRLGANTRESVSDRYDVRFIPHYALFDREGNLVENKTTRPGDPETEKAIRELL
jgi:thiol-disulfide isomerase/thioredoxin